MRDLLHDQIVAKCRGQSTYCLRAHLSLDLQTLRHNDRISAVLTCGLSCPEERLSILSSSLCRNRISDLGDRIGVFRHRFRV